MPATIQSPASHTRHRVVTAIEHDFEKGLFHGCCSECAEPWPCSVQKAAIEGPAAAAIAALRAIVVWDASRGTSALPRSLRGRALHALRMNGRLTMEPTDDR